MNINFVSTRVSKAVSAVVMAVVLFVSNPLSGHANGINDKKNPSGLNKDEVSIQYVGSTESNVVFSVKYENPTAQKFWLIVKNDAGETIYRQQFNEAHFNKSIYLQKDEAEIHPTFVIRKGNDEVAHSFVINRVLTENVVVTKL